MLSIDIRGDIKPLQKAFTDFQKKQVPFATALALTRLAQGVQGAEQDEIKKTFDTPTPFTVNGIAIKSATKASLTAVVYPKAIAAAYLAPYVVGGNRHLGKKQSMLVPINAKTNAFGNLPRNAITRFKGKPGVFVGSITFKKSGETVTGVWQRGETPRGKRTKGGGEYGTRGNNMNKIGGVRTTLKLLVEFEATTPVRKNLEFYGRANAYLRANVKKEFEKAFAESMKNARP